MEQERKEQEEQDNTTYSLNQIDNTHNNCTLDKCRFNPLIKKTLNNAENAEIIKKRKNECLANFCIGCGKNMGDCNPRQYCYKLYCPFENVE